MAISKLALTTLTLIVFFIVLSQANHLPLVLPDDDSKSIRDHPSLTMPEPDFKKTILLPSEKPETEPATVVDLTQHDELEEIDSNLLDQLMSDVTEVKEKEERVEDPEPDSTGKVVVMDLHPVTRPRFPVGKGMFEISRPHHRCQHPRRRHHHDFYHQFDTEEVKLSEVSYGNDMLVEDGAARPEEEQFDLVRHHGGGGPGRRAPSRWFSFHSGGRPRFDPEHDHHHHHHHHGHDNEDHHDHEHDHHHGPNEEDEVRRPGHRRRDRKEEEYHHDHDHGHHRHHDDFGEEMKMKRRFGQEPRDGGGLMKRVRKFLHLLEF